MKTCAQCQSQFEVTDEDRMFYEKVSPVFSGRKYLIPEPTLCPDCRRQRRLGMCNERNLYPRHCQKCYKKMLSQYPSHVDLTVYCKECWQKDDWDPTDYGQEFDFNRPFFDQFKDLKTKVPCQALDTVEPMINSEYVHFAGHCKNCYLIMHADYCEDCYYGYGIKHSKNCVDGFYNLHCELCYDCVDVHKSYGLTGCQDCLNCHNSAFLKDCVGVKNSFLCVGLREKEYCFENQQLGKIEYEQKMADIDLRSHQQYQYYAQKLVDMAKNHPYKYYHGQNNQNSTGDHLNNCKDARECFDCEDIENAKYCFQVVTGGKNLYDICQYGLKLEESYETSISGNSYHVLFGHSNHGSSDTLYCWYTLASKNCFGSTQLNRKQYCILNKQYSKIEYQELVPKIIEHMRSTGEWGEAFPMTLSPFGYNKTSAQFYYPLTKKEVTEKNWKWDDYENPSPQVEKIIPAAELPDSTQDIPDDILTWAIRCEQSGKLFKLTPHELKFYRQNKLPIPRLHPDERHMDRFAKRNPRKLWNRECGKCGGNIQTSYPPAGPNERRTGPPAGANERRTGPPAGANERRTGPPAGAIAEAGSPSREEVVYCETCYLSTVY